MKEFSQWQMENQTGFGLGFGLDFRQGQDQGWWAQQYGSASGVQRFGLEFDDLWMKNII